MPETLFRFACPGCGTPLEWVADTEQVCPSDGKCFSSVDGIWRFLLPARAQYLAQFIKEYETIRAAENRGSDEAAYYRALPFADLTGRFVADWRIRSFGFESLVKKIIAPAERGSPLSLLDLGAGNGWLSYRLAQRGHRVAAVDLSTDRRDGLGAHIHYDSIFTPVQAEFDCLPFVTGQFDAAIFNSSFHYSEHFDSTLQSALGVVKPGGLVVILDTPIYKHAASGEQMVAERQAGFKRRYGFRSNALASENFLTYARLLELGKSAGVEWRLIRPFRGWRWAARPWIARLRGRREPAEFLLIVGRKGSR